MKKRLTLLLVLTLLLLPANSLFASSDEIPFFEALGNTASAEDYKLIQSIYGNAEFEEFEDHVSVDYRITTNNVTDGGNRIDTFNRISAYIKFTNLNEVTEATPFKEMTIQANAEVITKNQTEIYFKLNNVNIGTTEALPEAIVDIENATAMIDLYRNTWYHTSIEELSAEGLNEEIEIDQYMELEEKMKENPKEALIEAFQLGVESSGEELSEDEVDQLVEVAKTVFGAKIFTQRDIVSGRNAGFKFFNLNKGAIMDLLEEVAGIFDEEISTTDSAMIRAGLGKISLSGIYRIEDVYNLIDIMLVRFRLKDVGPLVNLELNFRYKLSDVNKENVVKAPTEYEEWVNPFGFDDNSYYEDWPEEDIWEESDWELEESDL